ncbi:MAG: serine/threonine protein kinase [Myxococcales bacterium]|nr:serine/threonine protein kinase [Myxococcales bacterium]
MTTSRAPTSPDLLIGRTVGTHYVVTQVLARGQRSATYLAEHRSLHRQVVLKLLDVEWAGDSDAANRFEQAARSLSTLVAPNIAALIDFGRDPGRGVFVVAELVEGESLADFVARKGSLSLDEFVPIAAQLLKGLGAAHLRGLLHLDLKPANVRICVDDGDTTRGFTRILDLGLVQLVEGHVQGTEAPVVGDPRYLAPEQISSKPVDTRTDVYALGAIFYELLAGRPPFVGADAQVVYSQVNDPPPRLADLVGDEELPEELIELIAVALEGERGPGDHRHRHPPLERGDPRGPGADVDRAEARRRQAGEAGVGGEEAAEAGGAPGDHLEAVDEILVEVRRPLGRRSADELAEVLGDRLDRRQRVVDLVAEHPHEALPGLPLLLPQGPAEVGEDDQGVGEPALAEVAAAELPGPRAAREDGQQGPRGVALEAGREAERGRVAAEEPAGPAEEAGRRVVGEAEDPLRVEGEDRDVDLLHHLAEERVGFEGAEPLLAEGVGEPVDLAEHARERVVVALRDAGAEREVLLAEGGEEGRDRVQRAGQAGVERRRAAEPGDHRDRAEGPARLGAVIVEEEEREGDDQRGRPGREGEEHHPHLVAITPPHGSIPWRASRR